MIYMIQSDLKFVIANEDFMINEKICIYLNSELDYKNIDSDVICKGVLSDINNIIQRFSLGKNNIIMIIDCNAITLSQFPIAKIKILIKYLTAHTEDILYKAILYNAPKSYLPIINMIRAFLDPVTKKKIVINNNVDKILRIATTDKNELEKISTVVNY